MSLITKIKNSIQFRLNSLHRGPFAKLSNMPPIYKICYLGDRYDPFLYLYPLSFRLIHSRIYYLCSLYWNMNEERVSKLHKSLRRFNTLFKNHKIFFLVNTLNELSLFDEYGIKSIFCNHNCFVDENIFKPQYIEKIYDAIYDSRLAPFKRHELAQKISILAVINYIHPQSFSKDYSIHISNILNHAHWFNGTLNNYKYLDAQEINSCLNQSKIGLCLSKEEGAMYASIQYLLSGLPVVSTINQGGRDEFFDPLYVRFVPDDPDLVNLAVQDLISHNIDPDLIRIRTIKKINAHRDRFFNLVNEIYKMEGIEKDFRKEWPAIFYNKLISWDVNYKDL